MPGFTTHYLFGENTLQSMEPSPQKDLLLTHRKVFHLGLQGPDIFFYHAPATVFYRTNPGNLLHSNKSGDFFGALLMGRLQCSTDYEKDVCQAYICGFMGHYTLDSNCHPYVYFRSHYERDHGKGYFGRHVQLESDMDAFLLKKEYDMVPSRFSQRNTIAILRKDRAIIARLVQNAFHQCFPDIFLSKSFVRHAIGSIQLETFLMKDAKGYKKHFVRKVEQLFIGCATISALIPSDHLHFYEDPCNLEHKRWHNPWNVTQESFASVPEIMKQGEPILRKRIALCYMGLDEKLLSDLGNISYLNGLPLK